MATPGELRYDPEHLAVLLATTGGQIPVPAPVGDFAQLRAKNEQMMHAVIHLEPFPENVKQTVIDIKSHDGVTIKLHHFTLKDAKPEKPGSAVVYLHGGGMISCTMETYAPLVARYAARTGIPFFGVDFRSAPEVKDDGIVKDAYAGLEYISSHGAELGVDPARLAVIGDSGGGGIAAGTALMARDRGLSPPLSKQVLIYPQLDDRTPAPGPPLEKFLFIWGPEQSKLAWEAVLGEDKAGKEDADVSIYAAPGRATDLRNLPDTYVEVGGLDFFANESIAYVAKLAKAGVQTEFHLWPGMIHGFDVSSITGTKIAYEARDRVLKSL